jgi:hypothetical protein
LTSSQQALGKSLMVSIQTGDPTGGDAGNTLAISVLYLIV